MPNLSAKELDAIKDLLTSEQTVIQKCKSYAMATPQPQLKAKYEQIAAKHQSHYNRLYSQLG